MEQSYLPLFRKYRPQSFQDIVGQPSLVKALTNAIELNRIANAYLFCGPRGTGKTSSARIFAKSLNCEHGPTVNPCQKCASCVDITNASGLDVIEIDAASNRGIQDAKELIAQARYAPISGKYKIFIIDEVHMLSTDAFNALLKTFEEPPKNVIFILATTEPHKVLETIVSRCQRFDLRRITTSDIVKRLREISDKENIKITDDALFTIAKNVSGGLRDSLALLDQVSILGIKEEISKDLIEELLGKINTDTLCKLLQNILNQNIEETLLLVEKIYSKGNEPANLTENFIDFLKNTVLVLNSKDPQNIKDFTVLIQEDIEKIQSLNLDKEKVLEILNIMIEYYKEIKTSTNPYLWFELACIFSAKSDMPKISIKNIEPKTQTINQAIKLQAPIEEIKPRQPKEANPEEENVCAKSEEKEPVLQDSAEIWLNILSKISSLPTKALYSGTAKLVKIENNKITLGFTHDNALNQAKAPNRLSILENTIKSLYPNLTVELIKISHDTKVIEVKPKVQPKSQYQAQNAYQNTSELKNIQSEEKSSQQNEEQKQPVQKTKKDYSAKVQDMIEQFSGKIIED